MSSFRRGADFQAGDGRAGGHRVGVESGTLELEDSLKSYERGVSLLGSLQRRLGAAEQQVEVLMGELSEAPDDSTQDSTLTKA